VDDRRLVAGIVLASMFLVVGGSQASGQEEVDWAREFMMGVDTRDGWQLSRTTAAFDRTHSPAKRPGAILELCRKAEAMQGYNSNRLKGALIEYLRIKLNAKQPVWSDAIESCVVRWTAPSDDARYNAVTLLLEVNASKHIVRLAPLLYEADLSTRQGARILLRKYAPAREQKVRKLMAEAERRGDKPATAIEAIKSILQPEPPEASPSEMSPAPAISPGASKKPSAKASQTPSSANPGAPSSSSPPANPTHSSSWPLALAIGAGVLLLGFAAAALFFRRRRA